MHRKRILIMVAVVAIIVLSLAVFAACGDSKSSGTKLPKISNFGKYYLSDGETRIENRWIELVEGGSWNSCLKIEDVWNEGISKSDYEWEDDFVLSGTFELSTDGVVTLYCTHPTAFVNVEIGSGSLSNGIMVIELFGYYTSFRIDGAYSEEVSNQVLLTSLGDAVITDLSAYMEVNENVEALNLSGLVTVSKGCTWHFYNNVGATYDDEVAYPSCFRN